MATPRTIALLSLVALAAGCASGRKYETVMTEVESAYLAGDFAAADAALDAAKKDGDGMDHNVHLYGLEQAMVDLAAGDTARAQEAIRQSGGIMFDTYKALGSETYRTALGKINFGDIDAYISDDWALTYLGEDFEHVVGRVIGAMAALVERHSDFNVYATQASEWTELFRDWGKEYGDAEGADEAFLQNLRPTGAGHFLNGVVAEKADRIGAARAAYAAAFDCEGIAAIDAHAKRCEADDANPAKSEVWVLLAAGRAPTKISVEDPELLALLQASELATSVIKATLEAHGSSRNPDEIRADVLPPSMTFFVPQLQAVSSGFESLSVSAGGTTENVPMVADFERLAFANFEKNRPTYVRRSFVRKIVKGVVTVIGAELGEDAAEQVTGSGDAGKLAGTMLAFGGLLWRETESADTRSWRLLPGGLYAARLELEPGNHEIVVTTHDAAGNAVGVTRSISVETFPGERTYVVGVVPNPSTPTVLTSSTAR